MTNQIILDIPLVGAHKTKAQILNIAKQLPWGSLGFDQEYVKND